MFFIILIIPFTYLENNNNVESFSSYDQIMNSSLDIFYTNQNRQNRVMNNFKKYPILHNPIQATLVRNKLKPVELYLYTKEKEYNGIYVIYNNEWKLIYASYQGIQNIFTYFIASDFKTKEFKDIIVSRVKKFNNKNEMDNLVNNAPESSYIIMLVNDNSTIVSSTKGSNITVIKKKNNAESDNKIIIVKNTTTSNFLNIYQTVKFDDVEVETGGELSVNVPVNEQIVSSENDPLIQSKINIISPVKLSPDYSLSITVENNESFVYLSSRKLEDEVVLYAKSPKNDIGPTSTTYLDTQKPQFWSFEPVTPIITNPLIVFIRTYSKPYFYLDAEMENGVMVLKANRFKAGLRQHWEIIKDIANSNQYKLRHLKSKTYLAYSDYDGYLYNSDGSVFLTKSDKYNWNIKNMAQADVNKNVIEGLEGTIINTYTNMEVPTDYGTVQDPNFKISRNINGKNVVIESKGRTLWDPNFGPIWSGKWIYYGTVDSYKATQNINNVKFLLIKIDQIGSGIVEDEYLGYKMDVINAGSNILTGIIPTGQFKGYRAKLELLESSLEYKDPSKPFPVKMRYFIEQGSTVYNLSSGNVYNMQGYSTKFVGDKLVLTNFMEASGIQTDANLAFSEKTLNEINDSIKEALIPKIEIFEDTNCVYGRLYNGSRKNGSNNDYNYLGNFNSFEECAKSPKIPPNAKAITYHNDKNKDWARQCFSINDNNTKVSNQNDAVCGIRIVPKIMYGPWISKQQETVVRKLGNRKIVYIIYDDEYTKMVSSDGQEKYYKGTINKFNQDDWDKYASTSGGKYLLKDINAIVFEHGNYQGRSLELGVGYYDYNYLVSKGFNDNISSIIVPPELLVEGWQDNHGAGPKWVFNSNTNWVGNDANDRISTLVVKKKVLSNTWNVIWKADVGYINFSIDDNKKIAFHFNIRETTTLINTYDGGWGEAKFIQNFHSLRRPINFEISFNVSTGFTVVYQGNQENERIVANFPNRLNVPNANIFTITSSDNIAISFKNPEKRPVPPCPQGWWQSGNQCFQICKLNCQSRHSDGTCICNSGGCNQNCNYGIFSCLNNKCIRDASF
jgi:hypothetical protein